MVCDVDEAESKLPRSFGGMSGGPCITTSRRLLGVNTGEIRRKAGSSPGEFYVTCLSDLRNLFEPYVVPSDAPTDYSYQKACLRFTAASQGNKVPALVHVEYFWSDSDPDAPHGRVGRIIGACFGEAGGAARYTINTESIFRWYDGDSDEDRLRAASEELDFFLQGTGFNRVVETP